MIEALLELRLPKLIQLKGLLLLVLLQAMRKLLLLLIRHARSLRIGIGCVGD